MTDDDGNNNGENSDFDSFDLEGDPPGHATLNEVREWVRVQAAGKGVTCPCCGQFAKVYSRQINHNMVRLLVRMHGRFRQEYGHVRDFADGTGDVAKLRWWGLVEEAAEVRDDGGRAGWWRVTDRGAQYLHGRIHLPKYALVYNNRLQGFTGDPASVADAVKERFDLAKLMEMEARGNGESGENQ